MNTQPRPTPKTDALRDLYENHEYRATVGDIWELCEFLERERDEWKAKFIQQNKDLGCELRDPNGTIWDHAQTLHRELAMVREQRDRLTK